ncbi:MAG: hypothetical protein ACI4HI_10515 [Lachnospiraceae bacterium]
MIIVKQHRKGSKTVQLSDLTFDLNMDYDVDIKPIAKSKEQYQKWMKNDPFYANVNKEGVTLYESA